MVLGGGAADTKPTETAAGLANVDVLERDLVASQNAPRQPPEPLRGIGDAEVMLRRSVALPREPGAREVLGDALGDRGAGVHELDLPTEDAGENRQQQRIV